MNIHDIVLGELQTNGYVLTSDADEGKCVIIDSGLENSELIRYLNDRELVPEAIILTHGHADHIVGVRDLRDEFEGIKVVIHEKDAEMLTNPMMNLSAVLGVSFKTAPADILLDSEQTISFAGIEFEVLETPGHTPGGISLYCRDENVVFPGDTLFAGSVGRSDFPGGNHDQLINSIKEKLLTLPGPTKVYPGHGFITTISMEKDSNPYLR